MRVLFVGIQTKPEDGGAHSFQETVIDALKNYFSNHEFIFTSITSGEKILNEKINALNIDFVWFLFPYHEDIESPFAITVWDLAHRKHPYFPEVSLSGWNFNAREQFYSSTLPKASLVISGSEILKQEIHEYYGVPLMNILTIPLPLTSIAHDLKNLSFPNIYGLLENDIYLFYPAQFWPHKNHKTLIDTIELLRNMEKPYKLVFCGSDKGNQGYIQDYVFKKRLAEKVIFAGFVDNQTLFSLYKHASSLVFSSAFGPDNLPPLEAMMLECPVICSRYEGAYEQLGDAALYFETFSANEIADQIIKLEDDTDRQTLIKKGKKLLASKTPYIYCTNIIQALDYFAKIRALWESGNHYKHL
jgi:glycosyltransferase involved in cell wall biosynthesis